MPEWPTPTRSPTHWRAYLKTTATTWAASWTSPPYENKQEEQWELMTYVLCEVLAWGGIWFRGAPPPGQRRCRPSHLSRSAYYSRWLWSVGRVLIEKKYITWGELTDRLAEVQQRVMWRPRRPPIPEAAPKCEGDPSKVKRNSHIIEAMGKTLTASPGRPAGHRFKPGDRVRVKELPAMFYTRTPGYCRGAGESLPGRLRDPAPGGRTWDRGTPRRNGCFVVRFRQAELWDAYTGPSSDACKTGSGFGSRVCYRQEGTAPDDVDHGHDHNIDGDHIRTVKPMVDEITDFGGSRIALRRVVHRSVFHRRSPGVHRAEQIGPTPAARRGWWPRVWIPNSKLALADAVAGQPKAVGVDWLDPTRFGTPSDFTAFQDPRGHPDGAPRDRLRAVLVLPAADPGQLPGGTARRTTGAGSSRWPRQVLAEFGLQLPRVWKSGWRTPNQSTASWSCRCGRRYRGLDRDQLAEIITRDCLIGVALPKPG